MSPPIILLGHRGTGKTTLAALLEDTFEVIDLDEVIEAREAQTCAQLIASDQAHFRRLEARLIHELSRPASSPRPRLIVPGAGCEHLPQDALYILLRREGWVQTARDERARLRPELGWQAEVDWMIASREPGWQARAHLVLDIPCGADLALTADRLRTLATWLTDTCAGLRTSAPIFAVPTTQAELARASHDVALLGWHGVEVRSDLFPTRPELTCPALLSLRTHDPAWFDGARQSDWFDLDIAHADLLPHLLTRHSPRPLLLSTHPERCEPEDLLAMHRLATEVARTHPGWAEHMILKFAPSTHSAQEVEDLLGHLPALTFPVTFLPQGERFAWMRPWLTATLNRTSYMPVGCSPWRLGLSHATPSPWDLQSWLPFLTGSTPQRFDALLGDPVRQSVGDVWHRRWALEHGQTERAYLKVPCPRETAPHDVDALLRLLRTCHTRGISITSPLKRALAARDDVRTELSALNTLRDEGDHWLGTDTDEAGMRGVLDALHERGIRGDVALLGKGGVSAAVVRAIAAHPAFTLAYHAGARDGWGEDAPAVELVVNAAGLMPEAHKGAPSARAWLDLHYTHVRPVPSPVHLCGDLFFDAQARAQQHFWNS